MIANAIHFAQHTKGEGGTKGRATKGNGRMSENKKLIFFRFTYCHVAHVVRSHTLSPISILDWVWVCASCQSNRKWSYVTCDSRRHLLLIIVRFMARSAILSIFHLNVTRAQFNYEPNIKLSILLLIVKKNKIKMTHRKNKENCMSSCGTWWWGASGSTRSTWKDTKNETRKYCTRAPPQSSSTHKAQIQNNARRALVISFKI